MRVVLPAMALLLTIASIAHAGPKEEALEIVLRWGKAFNEADVEAMLTLHAPDALFIGTSSKTVLSTTDAIRKYLTNALADTRPRTAKLISHDAVVLSDSVVVVTGLDSLTALRAGQPSSAVGRVTFVVAKRGSDWKIVHFHRSRQP